MVQMASIAIPAEAEILKACKTRTLKRYSTVSETKIITKRVHFNQAH